MNNHIEVLKALADENRLNIIDILSCGELCVCDIMEGLELTQPTVSHHLKILRSAGLVSTRKEGKWRIFSIEKSTFDEVSNYITYLSSHKTGCKCEKIESTCD